MGIHSGPVSAVTDVNDRTNIAGAGINLAQRVMDCGDAGHILLSKRIADDLAQDATWHSQFHDLGECEVKHGIRIPLVNLHTEELGNSAVPEKLKTARVVAAAKKRRTTLRLVSLGAVVLLAAAAMLAFLFVRYAPRFTKTTPAVSEKSIAVLPFENLSEDKQNAYFASGVQDEILDNLAKVADLKVISRTSVMEYSSCAVCNLRDIAKTLGVSHVVEGSVQRAGSQVRVVAQLIDARSDAHVWAQHYDRDFADIFAIQSEIAQQIADQLRAKLSTGEKAAIAERPTADLVAYAYYTEAQEMDLQENWEGNEKNMKRKLDLLYKATQRDPNFALAYCALARTHLDMCALVGDPGTQSQIELSKKAAQMAVRVRPDLGEAHLELARYYFYEGVFTNNYGPAREELAIVRRKLPNSSDALTIEALIDRHENRWDDAVANLQRAHDLDPENGEVSWHLEQIYLETRRYSNCEQLKRKNHTSGIPDLSEQVDQARLRLAEGDPASARSILEQVPLDYSPGRWVWTTRFMAALYSRDYDAASRVIAAIPTKWADIAFGDQTLSWAEGQVARARGDKQTAQQAFVAARKKMEAKFDGKPDDPGYLSAIAEIDAGLGRKEEAIREARRAAELMPISKDAVNAPAIIANLALVYAWTGERQLALEQLEKVATIPASFELILTYGDLKFNPCWDDLRADPRFDKIVAACKAASK